MNPLAFTQSALVFLFLLARTAGFFVSVPVFGSASIPPVVKAAISFVIAILLYPIAAPGAVQPPDHFLPFTGALLLELLLGILLGYMALLLVEGFRIAGEMLGIELGFGMVSVMDPESQIEESMLELFMFFIFVLLFLSMDLHHGFLLALGRSFDMAPVGGIVYPMKLFTDIIEYSAVFFGIALQLSLPIIGPLFIITVILGIVSKAVPRMEVFLISFPLKIFLGFLLFSMLIRVMPELMRNWSGNMFAMIENILTMLK